jgi:protein-tyrosine phosphatase
MMATKILMVCLGNICRSPLAEGILKKKVGKSTFVDSAGTAAYHIGNQPDPRSISVGKKNGIDISYFRARKFTKEDFRNFNYIYVMDKSNYNDVLSLTQLSEDHKKVKLILDYEQEVPDPYFGEVAGFDHCYNLLDKACDQIVKELNL